jgi:vancomycin resistance protein VanJ
MSNFLNRSYQKVLGWLGWGYLGSLLVWFILRSIFFDRFWWLALLNTFAVYLFLPIVVLMPVAIWHRRRWLIIGLVLSCLLFVGLFPPRLNFLFPSASQPEDLRAMTFNLLWHNRDYSKIARMIRQVNPDLIGVQELQPKELPNLLAAISSSYPYHAIHPVDRFHTVGLFSRLPIEAVAALPEPPIERGLQATIRYQQRSIRVLVTHLVSNYVPPGQPFIPTIARVYRQRAAEIEWIQTAILDRPALPTVMLCDCNLTDTSEGYQQLRRVLKDSFQERGGGLGYTRLVTKFALPIQRIDYVWHDDRWQSIDAFVGAATGSDHLPSIASLRLR